MTLSPEAADRWFTWLCGRIRGTERGRVPRFGFRDGQILAESAPSVVDQLAERATEMMFGPTGGQTLAFTSVERLTAEQGQAGIAENYAAYVAKHGQPATTGDSPPARQVDTDSLLTHDGPSR